MGRRSRYPPEFREEAIRLYRESETSVAETARRLGMGAETLRKWVRQAEIEGGARPGVSSVEAERVKELEREVKELRRANEILKAASVFFARELDPQPPKR